MKLVRIWITVPTRYFRGRDRANFIRTFERDVTKLNDELASLLLKVKIDWFDPVNHSWGKSFMEKIDKADILLYYHWNGDCFFGKGAKDIYDDYYGLKPQYLMYRTKGSDELKFYDPIPVFETLDPQDWHKHMGVSFGMSTPLESIVEEIARCNDENPEDKGNISKWRYLYHSIFNSYG